MDEITADVVGPMMVFYTVNTPDGIKAGEILHRWQQAGVWDPRITRWDVGELEAEERASVETPDHDGAYCPGCGAGTAQAHAWWCHGDTCVCGCPKTRHHYLRVREVTTRDGQPLRVARRCRGQKCKCRGYIDVEYQAAWLKRSLTDEEKTVLRHIVEGALMDWAFGVGIFDREVDR